MNFLVDQGRVERAVVVAVNLVAGDEIVEETGLVVDGFDVVL